MHGSARQHEALATGEVRGRNLIPH